jgi:tetratricopeptide (TPR) repeat protein
LIAAAELGGGRPHEVCVVLILSHRASGSPRRVGTGPSLVCLLLGALLELVGPPGQAAAQGGPELFELSYSRGAMEFSRGRYEEAERHFRAALKAKPDDPEASAFLGQTLLRRKRVAEAEAVFRRMLQVDPASGQAWLGLGIVQYTRQDFKAAKESLLAAEKAEPENALVHYYLGLVHHELGEYDAAPERFKKAITLSPDLTPTAQYYSGVAHLRRGALAEAREALEATIAAEPDTEHGRSAKELLAQVEAAEAGPPSRWKVNASAGTEYDTNVVLLPGGTSPPAGTGISRQADWRAVLAGSLDYQAIRMDRFVAGLNFSVYQTFQAKLTGFNIEDLQPTAYAQYQFGSVSIGASYIYNYTLVGQSPYLNANTGLGVVTVTESPATYTQFQFRYMNKDFRNGRFLLNSARSGKNWLAGVTQYLAFAENKGRMWTGFIFDTDVTGGGHPTVAGPPNTPDNADWDYKGYHITTGLEMPPVLDWELSLAFDWIYQHYANPNSFSTDGITRRRDNIYSTTVALSRDLTEHFTLTLQYAYTRDDSNIDVFQYVRNIYTISLGAQF